MTRDPPRPPPPKPHLSRRTAPSPGGGRPCERPAPSSSALTCPRPTKPPSKTSSAAASSTSSGPSLSPGKSSSNFPPSPAASSPPGSGAPRSIYACWASRIAVAVQHGREEIAQWKAEQRWKGDLRRQAGSTNSLPGGRGDPRGAGAPRPRVGEPRTAGGPSGRLASSPPVGPPSRRWSNGARPSTGC